MPAELLPCSQLEHLLIGVNCTVLPTSAAPEFPLVDTYLPDLKSLIASCCLGRWSLLFECYRPALETLALPCPHIGMVPRSQFNWADIQTLWPNIHNMGFDNVFGLTVETVREIVLPLKKLARISLPWKTIINTVEDVH